ncbi:unnamed protein product [Ixodes hexagonus]
MGQIKWKTLSWNLWITLRWRSQGLAGGLLAGHSHSSSVNRRKEATLPLTARWTRSPSLSARLAASTFCEPGVPSRPLQQGPHHSACTAWWLAVTSDWQEPSPTTPSFTDAPVLPTAALVVP